MIVSRTPLRMSFVGGGSDLPTFYERSGGAVLSTAIDKYVYVTCNRKFDNGIRVAYSKTEEVSSVDKIEHPLVRQAMTLLAVKGGVEITTIADVPSRGTGLGSSSSFTVGLLNALHAFGGRHASAATLAEQSCRVEIEMCREPIGKQDQYAAAFGGLNFIEFRPDGMVNVTPIVMGVEHQDMLARRILMFYTGKTRSASELLRAQSDSLNASAKKRAALRRMVELAYITRKELQADNLDSLGMILHESWSLKQSLANGVSNAAIDNWYTRAVEAGAEGGKLLGAGAGGFLIFYAREERHEAILRSLSDLRQVAFRFEPFGSRIVFYNP
jgi:D-glycero-alpha-D-manno-heptose-7-phosphate kinase